MTKTYQLYSRSPHSKGGIDIQIGYFSSVINVSDGHKQTVMGKEKLNTSHSRGSKRTSKKGMREVTTELSLLL